MCGNVRGGFRINGGYAVSYVAYFSWTSKFAIIFIADFNVNVQGEEIYGAGCFVIG